jgi:hypothetical protein
VQSAVSVVPGLGTAVSEVIATAESAYDAAAAALSGNPLEGAIHAAYNYALGAVPGAAALHPVLDPVFNTLMNLVIKKEPVDSALLDGVLSAVPNEPHFGPLTPRSVAASLAHMIVSHLGIRKNPASPVRAPMAPAPVLVPIAVHPHPMHPAFHPRPHPRPVALHLPARPKPRGVPHAAVHVKHAVMPPVVRPGSPGAPPGATHWMCHPQPGGAYACRWQ